MPTCTRPRLLPRCAALQLTLLCCAVLCHPPLPQATPELLSPADAYMYSAKAGAKQAEMSIAKTFTMALYAGAYIAFGGFLGLAVVSNCPGECAWWGGGGKGDTQHSAVAGAC